MFDAQIWGVMLASSVAATATLATYQLYTSPEPPVPNRSEAELCREARAACLLVLRPPC